MPAELYTKLPFGRRLRKIALSATAGLIKINSAFFSSVGVVFPPTVTTAPVISGSSVVGSVLTVTPGVYTNSPTVTRQWRANGTAIPGATSLTFNTTGRAVGESITCHETATNAGGNVSSTSNAIVLT